MMDEQNKVIISIFIITFRINKLQFNKEFLQSLKSDNVKTFYLWFYFNKEKVRLLFKQKMKNNLNKNITIS